MPIRGGASVPCEGGDAACCPVGGVCCAEAEHHVGVAVEHGVACGGGVVDDGGEFVGYAAGVGVVGDEFGHDGASGYEIDERDVGDVDEEAFEQLHEPSGAEVVADDLRHAEDGCLECGGARCDEGGLCVAEQGVGLAEDEACRRACHVRGVDGRVQPGCSCHDGLAVWELGCGA